MRRRGRRIRSIGRRPGPGGNPRVQQQLQRANRLLETGDHANAAVIFARLAEGAFDRRRLKHAPFLFLQAANAYLLSGQGETGLAHARKGLEILAETNRWPALHRAGQRTIHVLKETGMEAESQEISAWLEETLADHPEAKSAPMPSRGKPASLPPKCPFCGATVRSDEVNWIDNRNAECIYCGSAVQTEG